MKKIVQYSKENYRIMEALLRDAMTDLKMSKKNRRRLLYRNGI